jgi:hypothetical protein
MNTIRITPDDGTGYRVYLDGVDISEFVSALSFSISAGGAPNVWMKLVGRVEIPEDIFAHIVVTKDFDDDSRLDE